MKTPRAGVGALVAMAVGFGTLAAAPAARAQVKLEYKYPEGQTLTYKISTTMKQVLTLNGTEIPTDVDQTIVTSQAIGKRAADSSLPIHEKIESLKMELGLPGGNSVAFDSKEGKPRIDNPELAFLGDVFKLASEATFTIVLDGQNKVKAIEGAEKLQEKAEKLDPKVRDAMRSSMSVEKLKTEFEQSHSNLPDVLARPGEPWERTEDMQGGGGNDLVFKKKYEYVGTEKKGEKTLDRIKVTTIEAKLKEDPNSQAPAKVTKSDLKVESSEGSLLFDREAGRIVESRDKVHLKGTMTLR
ncbi:MAG: DUF6263 family protein, partial [Isosphaeraceae bacterium]